MGELIDNFKLFLLSDRMIIRDAIFERLCTDQYWIHRSEDECPSISIFPRNKPSWLNSRLTWLFLFGLRRNDNSAIFLISFLQQNISIESIRLTGRKIISTISYENPHMIDDFIKTQQNYYCY